jgi:hypothetical protein
VNTKPFWVIDQEWGYANYGILGLARPKNGEKSFLQVVLEEQKEQVLTMVYDQ